VIIRTYTKSDLNALTQLMDELGYPTQPEVLSSRLKRMESNPMYHTFVAEIKEEIVGMVGIRQFITYEFDEIITQISVLVTKAEFRRQGIGKALVQYVEQWSKHNGSDMIILSSGIKPERKQAHEFYKSIGFDITGYRFVKKL